MDELSKSPPPLDALALPPECESGRRCSDISGSSREGFRRPLINSAGPSAGSVIEVEEEAPGRDLSREVCGAGFSWLSKSSSA